MGHRRMPRAPACVDGSAGSCRLHRRTTHPEFGAARLEFGAAKPLFGAAFVELGAAFGQFRTAFG
jgi:hypothetical protein